MGAYHVIDHHKPLEDGLKAIGIPLVRYVAGLTATDKHQKSIVAALAPQGALAMIDDPETFDVVPFKRKSLSVHWELMFTRSLYGTSDIEAQHRILSEVSAPHASGSDGDLSLDIGQRALALRAAWRWPPPAPAAHARPRRSFDLPEEQRGRLVIEEQV
jgi:hypothetical protein